MTDFLIPWVLIMVGGACLNGMANRSKGRNGKAALKYAAWGTWLLLLRWAPILVVPHLPVLHLINIFVRMIPSLVLFLMAANSLLKEIRAQQRGEFTEAA